MRTVPGQPGFCVRLRLALAGGIIRTVIIEPRFLTMHIHVPLLHMSKAEIVRKGTELGVPYELTLELLRGPRARLWRLR